VWAVSHIAHGGKLKSFHHPVTTAFPGTLDRFKDRRGGVPFKVTDDVRQIFFLRAQYAVDMIAHDHIGPDFKSFECPAIPETVKHNIPVYFPGEYIDPIHNCKGEEVSPVWGNDFVTCCHIAINIWAGWVVIRFAYVSIRKQTSNDFQSTALRTHRRRSTYA